MPIATGNIIRCFAKCKFLGTETAGNTSHVYVADDNAVSQQMIRDDIVEYIEGIYTPLLGAMVASYIFDEIEMYNVSLGNAEPTEPWASITAGLVASAQFIPEGVAALIFARTGVNRVVGKKYLFGFEESNITSGLWVPGLVTALASSLAAWILPFTGTNGVILYPGVWRKTVSAFSQFTEGVVRDIPGYQRRRKRGVGQ